MKALLHLLLASSFVFLGSCATSATFRMKRIEANPEIYQALSPEDQALVQSGKIREGLDKKAVFLSWGRPDDIRQGSRKGVPYETWHFSTHRAHSTVGVGMGYGFYPYYGHYRTPYYAYPHYGFYPSVTTTYVPVKLGSVEFLNDKVVSWEARKR